MNSKYFCTFARFKCKGFFMCACTRIIDIKDMRKLYTLIALLLATCCIAQEYMPQAKDAYCWGFLPGYPYYYCECRTTSSQFSYPMDVQVTDTMWYSATVNDLKQGLSAYWFADCSVTFEVYAFCSSKVPTITMTVGANQMREMDVADINRKLDEMGDMAELMSQVLTPRVRIYPNGGTGHVYCYPYDQGPASTCDSILPVIPRMTYVCDQTTEVYKLEPAKMSSKGVGFIQWKQKKNLPGTIRLTADSCTGPEIANMTLSDSMRVMVLDSVKMKALKQANRSVFVHVSHPEGYTGRMIYRNTLKWDEQRIDTTLCQGKSLQLTDTVLSATTIYPNDTLWKKGDTLSLTTYHLTIEPPTPQYDTLSFKAAQLPTTYRNQFIPKDGWGDYDFTIHQADQCDERYLVHVQHDYVTQTIEKHDTICMGKTITYGGTVYNTDTIIRDSAWVDADTWDVLDITIHFTEPEAEYDTIAVAPSKMTDKGYWYAQLGVLVQYGDTLIVKTKKNTCTRWIYLTVEEGEEPDPTTDFEEVSSDRKVYKYLKDGVLYIRRDGYDYDLLGRPVKK